MSAVTVDTNGCTHNILRRVGMFRISGPLLQSYNPQLMLALFSKMIVLSAERSRVGRDETVYVAASPLFREIGEGARYPAYEIVFTTDNANGTTIEAVEQEPVPYFISAPVSHIPCVDYKKPAERRTASCWDPYGPDGEG